MYILGIRADKVTENDINRLIDSQLQENKSLDYKKELHISKDSDKKEFLYDVSAMYNTDGGCIIYGVEEEKDSKNQNTGKPLKVTGIEIQNSDKLFQQIEDIIKNCTEPSINHIIVKEVLVNSLKVLIIGIPKGIGLPSMVTFNKVNKFFKRRISGKYAVDVYELNNMFMQSQVLSEKANIFRKERIQTILSKENLPNLNINSSILIHIIPYSFLNHQVLDFSMFEKYFKSNMKPICSNGYDYMYNIDGFATFATSKDRQIITSYNQVFRNGIYEVYSTDIFYETRHNNQLGFDGKLLIDQILKSIESGLSVLNEMKIEPPFFVSFSFHDVLGKLMDNQSALYIKSFKQNDIVFPLILVPTYESDIKSVLKLNFDILWQSFGFPKCTE